MDDSNLVRQLRELSELHTSGEISTEEFSLAKERLLGRQRSTANSIRNQPRPVKNMPQPGGESTGGIVTAGGAALTVLAFFAMPMAEIPLISASATGADLASLGSESGSLAMLWLVLVLAITMLAVGLWQRFSSPATPEGRKVGSRAVLALTGIIFIIYIALLVSVQSKLSDARASTVGINAISFTGVGFWFALIGTLIATVGAFMVLNTARSSLFSGAFSTQDGATYPSLAALEADYKARRLTGPDFRRERRRLQALIDGTPDS